MTDRSNKWRLSGIFIEFNFLDSDQCLDSDSSGGVEHVEALHSVHVPDSNGTIFDPDISVFMSLDSAMVITARL